ncbi:hypothetical protein VMCG_03431 [Cytospora schulzeri]|uniref:Carboxylic ester hydrolase n=1 Tax=Cytospora schulzeri TaxID=448051 RepID=A0A423WW99_9PEZI|nr:hypothetical protein VMCG_03431 [Valsa malicola]
MKIAGIPPLVFSLSLASATTASFSHSSVPIVDLGYVKYAGYSNETAGINYYRGIKYASAPTGRLRWEKPSPIEVDPTYTGQSEDCLILDVLVPSTPSSKNLPVMVQIHGGGFTTGNALTAPGDAMVNASDGGLIYVAIQYRLGIFGFLAGSEVKENGVQNAGLYDQRVAIEWVQRHISAFGGDPSKVTIWGGSAGGSSVTYQLMAAGGFGVPPFRAAIAEFPWWQPLLNTSMQELQYGLALQASGCGDIHCLRGLSSEDLANAGQADLNNSFPGPGDGYGGFWYGPVVDGEFLRDLPDVAFKKGDYHKVPILVDHDGYEGVIFTNASQTSQVEETLDAHYIFPSAGPAFFSRLYQLYPRSAYNSTFFQRQSWYGDFIISCPTYQIATSAVDHISNSSAVFKLVFHAGSQLHDATAAFLNSNVTGWPSANNQTIAAIITSYWISFATTTDPNPLRVPEAPYWPSYTAGGAGSAAEGESVGFEVLDVTYGGIEAVEDPDASEQCEFFLNKGYTLRN